MTYPDDDTLNNTRISGLYRTCSHGVCEGPLGGGQRTDVQQEGCNEDDCVCILSKEHYVAIFGDDPPMDSPVGWVETDGEEGKSPEEPAVSIGDTLDINAEVEIATDLDCGHWWGWDKNSMT